MSLYQIPKKVFWLEIRKTLLSFVLFIGVCVPIRKFFDPSNLLMLGIEMLLMLSLYFLMALLFVLGEEDKKLLRRIIKI